MRKGGRISAAALEVVQGGSVLVPLKQPRLAPPESLSAEESDVWRGVVEAMPADWFGPGGHGLLTFYCQHVVGGRRAAALIRSIEAGKDFDVNAYDRALRIREREGRAASSLATRLRLTPQTTRNTPTQRATAPVKRPWE